MQQSLYLASGNPHKSLELSELLAHEEIYWIVKPPPTAMPDVDECGDTFLANATIKAEALRKILPDEWILADDSGLAVDALDGAPGVHSARYAGVDATSEQLIARLLKELEGVEMRKARFVCVLVLAAPDGKLHHFKGNCEGSIALQASGNNGFAYDPVFVPDGYSESFGDLDPAVKAKISHRAHAASSLAQWLSKEV